MSAKAEHVVVIGAVALGPTAACRYKRLKPEARVTMVDGSDLISYGGCGIPYYVSGEVSEVMQLRTTSFHMLRDEKFFEQTKGVDVLVSTEATRIDREAKQVHIRSRSNETGLLGYDKLVIATGAVPRRLGLPGEELPGVHYVSNLYDAVRIREALTKGKAGKAVVIGAGFIGLEMAEALADMWGLETSVVEVAPQIMPRYVSPALAAMGRRHMEEQGVAFYLGESAVRFEGEGRVERVVTNNRTLEADVVVISVGVTPNSELARRAGLLVSERGAIVVDRHMRTSDPQIYAGGDCVEINNLVTGKPFYLPMGSMANRQGRVIGTNLAGGQSEFDGAVGTFVVKLFERSLAGAGLSLDTALKSGFKAQSVLLTQLDRAHFYPKNELMTLELVYEAETRRVLGIQGYGSSGDAMVGRINAVSGLLGNKPVIEDLSNLEMAYSPPFSSAMDIVNTLGNMADNAINGLNRGLGLEEFIVMWEERDRGAAFFLDCREAQNAMPLLERHPRHWHNIPQGEILERISEIPRDRPIVLVCNTGARAFEAQIMLAAMAVTNVINLHGGLAALKQLGYQI